MKFLMNAMARGTLVVHIAYPFTFAGLISYYSSIWLFLPTVLLSNWIVTPIFAKYTKGCVLTKLEKYFLRKAKKQPYEEDFIRHYFGKNKKLMPFLHPPRLYGFLRRITRTN